MNIDATYPHNSHQYTWRIRLKYPSLPSLPIPADLPRSAAESADEGQSRAPAQRGREFHCSVEESANKGRRRAPVNHREDHQRSVEENSTWS